MVANLSEPVAILVGISAPSRTTIACAGDPYLFPPPRCLCVYGALSSQFCWAHKQGYNYDACTDRFKASVHATNFRIKIVKSVYDE